MRILLLITALFLASCNAGNSYSPTSEVSVSFGSSAATGALGASGSVPANVLSVALVALAPNGNIIAGPVVANKPNFLLKVRIPNGNNIRLRIRAFSLPNASGVILYESFSKPLNLTGAPVTVPITMNLAVAIFADPTPVFRGATVNMAGFVSGGTPPASSPLIWRTKNNAGVTLEAPVITDTYGGTVEWTAPASLGTFTISAKIDPDINTFQEPNIISSVDIDVINRDPYVTNVSTTPLVVAVGSTLLVGPFVTAVDVDSSNSLTHFTTNKPSFVTITSTGTNPLTLAMRVSPVATVNPGVYKFTLGVRDSDDGSYSGVVSIQVVDAPTAGPTTISALNLNNTPCNATWTLAGSPYIVQTDVFIDMGCRLQINEGTTVRFDPGLGIDVYGTLDVYGTAVSPVTFSTTALSPTAGSWANIAYALGSSGTILHTTIDYAGSIAADNGLYIASNITLNTVQIINSASKGLTVAAGAPLIANLSVANTANSGVFITSAAGASTPIFSGINTITGVDINNSSIFVTGPNTTATIDGFTTDSGNRGLTITNSANATVTNNAFYSAQSDGVALSITNPAGDVILEDNVISRNFGYGIRIKEAASLVAQGNIIRNNNQGGIIADISQTQPISLYNNLIVKNSGSGVALNTTSPVHMYSNTIANNIPSLPTDGGVALTPGANVIMVNNILASNTTTPPPPANPVTTDVYTAGATGLTNNNNLTSDTSLGSLSLATITFDNGWYSATAAGVDAGAGFRSDYPFLSSAPYAASNAQDTITGQIDIGYHQKSPSSTFALASIISTTTLPTSPYSTVRVVFQTADSTSAPVLQPLDLLLTLTTGATNLNNPVPTGVYQVGQGLYACDIFILSPGIPGLYTLDLSIINIIGPGSADTITLPQISYVVPPSGV